MVQLKTQNNPPEEYMEAKYGLNVVQQDKGSNSQNWIGLQNLAYVQYMSSSHYFDRIWLSTIGLLCTNYRNDPFFVISDRKRPKELKQMTFDIF